ncbi:MAG TPA: nicotinamidase [Nitrospiria bacterium]|nr:nicotinamidase [Nitrospiria bacterium]
MEKQVNEKKKQQAMPAPGDALILVDIQNDFLPGGALAVPMGDEIIAPLNKMIAVFEESRLPVFATRDWHPSNHCSFKNNGGPWPSHCLARNSGAEFAASLRLPSTFTVISKGTTPSKDAYSGFEGTELDNLLRSKKIKRVYVGGLATDYCVLNTVRDAIRLGYSVFLYADGIRAVNVRPQDGDRAIEEMEKMGAVLIRAEN